MRSRPLFFIVLAFLITLVFHIKGYSSDIFIFHQSIAEKSGELLRRMVTEAGPPVNKEFRGVRIHSPIMLERFYERRNFRLAWYGNDRPLALTDDLVDVIEDAYHDGLVPESYHIDSIKTLLREVRQNQENKSSSDVDTLAELDLLLTDAFFVLGCHYSAGCVNPITIEAEWFTDRGEVDLVAVLEQALDGGGIKQSLRQLMPSQDSYLRLRDALGRYRHIASQGGWSTLATGPLLKLGSSNERVAVLRERLTVSGDLPTYYNNEQVLFDDTLRQAVVRFQKRHRLEDDGIVGPRTLQALNVSVEERVWQIMINLERLRWSSEKIGAQYVLVNIADFALAVIEDGQPVLTMKVVVGKPYWYTPVFNAKLTYIVLNPSWYVPKNIMGRDILPRIQKDRKYLYDNQFEVLRGWGQNEENMDPEKIDWSWVTADNLQFRLRQGPSPLNPLGRIKFMFPNRFSVYIHDSPQKSLFKNNIRSFSHGCIRIEKPIELAEYLLQGNRGWTQEKIIEAIQTGEEQTVALSRPVNVFVLYLTAWVDENGVIQFRKDVYGRDKRLGTALLQNQPTLH